MSPITILIEEEPTYRLLTAVDKLRFILQGSLNTSFAGSRVIGDPRT